MRNYSRIKRWFDQYAHPAEIKGSDTGLINIPFIICTSNYSLDECFTDPNEPNKSRELAPIKRRILEVKFTEKAILKWPSWDILIEEEKTVLIDTVWTPHRFDFVENLKSEIDLKKIDFIVANHAECDHSGSLTALMDEIPDTPIYCTAAFVKSVEGQFGKRNWNFNIVKTGDSIEIGNGKKLIFIEMKMLHWPDSMATYMTGDNILFSNDAFGQHFAVEELFTDRANQCLLWKEAIKYFVNILNPFAMLIPKKIEEIKSFNLPIDIIAPSHGAIWRENPMQIVEKYDEWAKAYQENQVTIAYDTMWEGTAKIAHKIAAEVHKQSPDTVVKLFNISFSKCCLEGD